MNEIEILKSRYLTYSHSYLYLILFKWVIIYIAHFTYSKIKMQINCSLSRIKEYLATKFDAKIFLSIKWLISSVNSCWYLAQTNKTFPFWVVSYSIWYTFSRIQFNIIDLLSLFVHIILIELECTNSTNFSFS